MTKAGSDQGLHAMDRGLHAAALASMPQASARRLQKLLGGRDPQAVWEELLDGLVPAIAADTELCDLWVEHAASVDLDELSQKLESLDVWVTTSHSPHHPVRFLADIDPVPVMFRRGRGVGAAIPAVTIVGTRRCSPTGKSVAFELGAGLAQAGVTVVSGLALGIDGAAHRGALSVAGATPIGVVGSGLDVVYPRGNNDLWRAMCQSGTLLSEVPLGGAPEAWRFPARNRLLAALADVLVVVESKQSGGSMLTVEQAVRRGITVMAVPGSVRNPAAAGTNQLVSEGCAPVCSVDDVLTALSLTEGSRNLLESSGSAEMRWQSESHNPDSDHIPDYISKRTGGHRDEHIPEHTGGHISEHTDGHIDRRQKVEVSDSDPSLSELHRRVLAAVDDNPVSIDRLVLRVGASAPSVLVATEHLEAKQLLIRNQGHVMRS